MEKILVFEDSYGNRERISARKFLEICRNFKKNEKRDSYARKYLPLLYYRVEKFSNPNRTIFVLKWLFPDLSVEDEDGNVRYIPVQKRGWQEVGESPIGTVSSNLVRYQNIAIEDLNFD